MNWEMKPRSHGRTIQHHDITTRKGAPESTENRQ